MIQSYQFLIVLVDFVAVAFCYAFFFGYSLQRKLYIQLLKGPAGIFVLQRCFFDEKFLN